MRDHFAEFDALGVKIIAIAMSQPKVLATYLKMQSWPFEVWCDPELKAYHALGLSRTSWLRILRPDVVYKYLKFIFHGSKVQKVKEGEDPLQLGGDFLISRDGKLLWAYRGEDPTDRPSIAMMLKIAKDKI